MRAGANSGTDFLRLAALLIAGDRPGHAILGTPRVEFQIRRARAVGAAHAVILAERVTADLVDSVARLRSEGLSIDIARSAGDAAELIHPDEAVLLLESDLLVAPERLASLVAHERPALLCVRDEPGNERFERIDPTARWTGYALVDGDLLRRTVAMVGDWDLASTLMRHAVQDGAHRLTLTPDELKRELVAIDDPLDAQRAGRQLVAAAVVPNAGWATRWLLGPLARVAAGFTGEMGIEARWVMLAGFVFSVVAVIAALVGWIVASLVFLLLGLFCDLAGDIGAQAGSGSGQLERWRYPVRASAAAIVVMAMGTTLFMRTLQWGCVVLVLVIIVATWLAAPLDRDDASLARWRADPAGHALIGLVGFVTGSPVGALVIAAIHTVISLGWVVRRVSRPDRKA
jgi:hypothetical protein